MSYKKIIAKYLLFILVLQLISGFFVSPVNTALAIDADGTANLDLTVTSVVEEESIIGTNFTVTIDLSNGTSSEGAAFAPAFMVKLPPDVVFISSPGLGAPVRTELLADGSTLLFFETDGFIPEGTSESYSLNLSSDVSADLFTPTDIEVLAYAEDSIYGVGSVPSGSPSGTLPGSYDYANSSVDPASPDFPDDIDAGTDLSTLPFTATTTQFIPFNIQKIGTDELLIGEIGTTTLRITGNDLGPLNDFEIVDVIPNTQKFVGFTSVSGATTSVAYDTPGPGQVTLTISNIDVPTGGVVNIQYETLGLAYEASSYTGTTVLLNTGALVTDQTLSTNIASHQLAGTWFDGNATVPVNAGTVISPRELDTALSFGDLNKSVNNSNPVIGDTIIYTVTYDVAQNVAYDSSNLGTYIEDTLPDGLSFVSEISSVNSGAGDALSLTTNSTSVDGDTTLIWSLGSGYTIEAGDFLTIRYSVLVDGVYEGAGDMQYENTENVVNNAQFRGNIIDSGNDEEWGFTDPNHIGTQDTDDANATITAPAPTNDKQLVRIVFPDSSVYDAGNPLPAGTAIPVGSRLDFNVSMDFPNVYFNDAKLIDALPLVTGPNTATYNIAFQTDNTLQDLNGDSVPINDDDADGIADTIINGKSLGGTTTGDTSWISTTPANNVEFDIGSGLGERTFSVGFSVDVLPVAPSGGAAATLPIKNVLLGTFNDDAGTLNTLGILNEPFVLGFPIIELTKDVTPDPTTNIAFGDSVTYNILIQNTGDAGGYLENIIDVLPANMNLDSFTMFYSGGSTPVPGASVVQSGATLEIEFNTQAPLNRSFLNTDDISTTSIDESTILLSYTLSPTSAFVIVGGEVRTNTIGLDYYSSGDAPSNDLNKIDSVEDEAEFTVASPTITRTYFSTSEADSPDNQPGGRPDIHAGEETVFETTITIPGGTYLNSRFTENLLTSRLTFLTGSVISTGPNLTFSNGTNFSGNFVDFGDIVNTGTSDQTIVIRTTAIGRNDVSRWNNARARGDFRYSGEDIQINTPVDLIIPTLIITKTVNPTEVDTDDIFTYTIEIEHTSPSNARAYDVLLKDILPSNVSYIAGTLAGNANFIGTEADLFSGSGIFLPSLADGSTETLTFDAEIGPGATATTNETNIATIDYSTLDDDGSLVEANFSATGSADVTVKSIEVTHYISSTNNTDTGAGQFTGTYDDLTIGEEVTYTIEVDVPALLFSGVTLTQTLPAGIEFLTGFTLTDGVTSHTIDTFTINADGTVTFDFGDIDNTGIGSGDGFVLETTAVVTGVVGNTTGDVVNSSILLGYDTDSTATDNTPNFDIVEPNVVITKTYSPDRGDGGDSIPTTITIQNTGTSPLYDISWTDTLPPKSTGGAGYLSSSSTGVLLPGGTITYTYDTILDNTVIYGEMLTGTASVMGDSMPGIVTEERDYSASANDIITIIGIDGLQKDLTSSGSATIGDVESYTIRVPISEGVTENISVADLIPAGMEIMPGSINITASGGVTYAGAVTPAIGGVTLGNTQAVDYIFTGINNSDTDNTVTEYITITYDVVVLNTSDNNDGDTKAEEVVVNYNSGVSILTDGPVPVTIVEPSVGIDLTSTYTYGNDVVYTYTITNTGSSTAYDIDINTILPTGLTYSGAITITNSGGVVGIIQAGDDFTLEELPVNTGSPLQFTIAGVIAGTVADMTDLTVNANLTYTGQDDVYTAILTNTDNTERTGTNIGVNDYLDADPDTITVLLPLLDESISVVDLNGGLGIINDTFEYTITLTNTGSVDLTDISAILDIPGSFTGFTIISIPTGSSDNSTATGGVDASGQVNIDGINIPIGQSVTIVYQVTALETVPSGAVVNSEVTVSDSPEGAIGGAPDVDVTILAPAIQLTKSIVSTNFNDPVVPNDTITYEFLVENTGDVTLYNIAVYDAMLGGDITSSCNFATGAVLTPSQTVTCSPASYSITMSDIIRGYVENSAEVNSEDESMNPVSDISDSGIGNETTETTSGTGATDLNPTNDPTVQMVVQNPELRVTKVITGTGFNVPNLVGDTISYEITVENVGNLNVTDITVSDVLLGGDITSSCIFPISATGGLNIGQTATCIPNDYVIGIPDIIRGYVDNNAVAIGTDSLDNEVRDTSDPGDEDTETPSGDGVTTNGDSTDDPTTVPLIGEAELTLTKVIASDTLSSPTASGDTITYAITVLNSGQLPVNNVTVEDPLLGGDITSSCDFPISASNGLEVGESALCTPAAYSIVEADIVRGYIDNNAEVDAFDPNDDPVDDVSDPGDEDTETPSGDTTTTDGDATNDPTTTPLEQNPSWTIRKTSSDVPEKVGDTIRYDFEIENTGNISINTPVITDQKCASGPTLTASSDISADGIISPNEIWSYTCESIPVTQAEVDATEVVNTVSATSSTALGNLPEIDTSITIDVVPTPDWKVEKSALSVPLEAGDTIQYQFLVTNTGNVSISGITVTDDKCALPPVLEESTDANDDDILFQDEVWTYTCTSISVTQIEADAATVLNDVVVQGTSASGSLDDTIDDISTPVGPTPNWTLIKSTDSTPSFSGETLEYDFNVLNTGNVTISAITLTDSKCSIPPILNAATDIGSDTQISPGEEWRYTCTSIPVTQAEVNAGVVNNTAEITGTSAQGTLEDKEATIVTPITAIPLLQLQKLATPSITPDSNINNSIRYNFTIRNTGNVTLENILLSDPMLGGNITTSCEFPISAAVGLLPNEIATCTKEYLLIEEDYEREYILNSATVTGDSPLSGTISDISDSGDETIEPLDTIGSPDNDPTNDPTIVKIGSSSGSSSGGSSSSSGGSSSSSSSSGSSGGGSSSSSGGGGGSSSSSSSSGGSLSSTSSSGGASSSSTSSSSTSSGGDTPEQTDAIPDDSIDIPFDIDDTLDSAKTLLKKYEEKQLQFERLKEESQGEGESKLKAYPEVLPQTGTPIFERVKKVASPFISTELPDESVFRLAGSTNSELNYWKQVLVDEDKNAKKYIIIPSNGMVMPVNVFTEDSEDFSSMINGREANINEPLETGALEYPGSSTKGYGELGNKVIFGHSSYFGSSLGRYKTHFQKIIELDEGEEIWVYEKQSDGNFKRFIYVTEASYNTPANDTSVLDPGTGKNLTLFTCTPIGGIEGRWIIKAKYYDEVLPQLEREIYFQDVGPVYKKRIEQFIRAVLQFDTRDQQEVFGRVFQNTLEVQKKHQSKHSIYRMLEYLTFRIAQSLVDGGE